MFLNLRRAGKLMLAMLALGWLASCTSFTTSATVGGFTGTMNSLPQKDAVAVAPLKPGTYEMVVGGEVKSRVTVPKLKDGLYKGFETPNGKIDIGVFDLDGLTKAQVQEAAMAERKAKAEGKALPEVAEVSMAGRPLVGYHVDPDKPKVYAYRLLELTPEGELVVYDALEAAEPWIAASWGGEEDVEGPQERSLLPYMSKKRNAAFLRNLFYNGDRTKFRELFRLRPVSSS